MATDLGTDVSATDTLDPNFTLVTGTRVVAEACFRRLTTERGSLWYAPDYGTDVREMMLAKMDQRRLDAWRSKIEAEVRKDQRVDTVSASIAFDPRTEIAKVSVAATTAAGPFDLVLAVSGVTVELLKVG
jgi:phage baseplate assembly protein W